MGFKQVDREGRGGYARIWSIENKGNYSVAQISTSKKRRDGEGYETDFTNKFVRLVGSAHTKAQELTIPEKGLTIQIISCEVTTPYNPETKTSYTNYAIFAFEIPDGYNNDAKRSAKTPTKTKKSTPVDEEDDDDSDFPF